MENIAQPVVEVQKEILNDIQAAYNNRLVVPTSTKEEECARLRTKLAEAMSSINNILTKTNADI